MTTTEIRGRNIMLPELEVCTGDYDSIMAAFLGGATRVEICAALPIGGLTPTAAVMEMTRHVAPAMKRHVLIRPRPGDFLYTDNEFMTMVAEMRSPGIMAADGYVIGILDADGNVDKERTALLMKCVGENATDCEGNRKSFTFHRAFDMTSDPFQALEDIIELGFDRILTSGCAATAEAGIPMLRRLNEQAAGRIVIMAGGGVNAANVRKIMEETGVMSLHGSCSGRVESGMRFRNESASMGAGSDDEYSWNTTSRDKVEALVKAIRPE